MNYLLEVSEKRKIMSNELEQSGKRTLPFILNRRKYKLNTSQFFLLHNLNLL